MEFSMKSADDDDNDEDGGGEDGGAGADPEQQEDAAQLKQLKQNKAVRKELLRKFKQEIVQRSLLPVLASVYRQVRNINDAPELFTATIRLVASLVKQAEIDLTGKTMDGSHSRIPILYLWREKGLLLLLNGKCHS